jgi:hypothetical protein
VPKEPSPGNVKIINWAGKVACIVEMTSAYRACLGNLKVSDYGGRVGLDSTGS